jgi:peptidoglycan/xylan/chitin deacetylase (PgdA/CDA1 family)
MTSGIITTSWDDGHPLDQKVGDLLAKYNLRGTFYVPRENIEQRPVLTPAQIRDLSVKFEIGGHTEHHRDLTKLPLPEADREIRSGKSFLEDVLGTKVTMFCFPRGRFNSQITELVQKAGFQAARTLVDFQLHFPRPQDFLMPVSLQAYPHSRSIYVRHLLKETNWSGLKNYLLDFKLGHPWTRIEYVAQPGGVFHLWGHSWEIEEKNLWIDLEKIFDFISNTGGFRCMSNSETLKWSRNEAFDDKEIP